MKKRWRSPALLLSCVLICGGALPLHADPVTYVMTRMTTGAGAATMASSGYQTTLLVAQASPQGAGSACNSGSIDSFGFWSVLGDLPVPIILRVQRNGADPDAIDLAWTGTDSDFQVCRDVTPQNICAHPYAFTTDCHYTDPGATAADAVFYSIIPKP